MTIQVYCDFDGTITRQDVVDLLLESLADPSWRELEERWESSEISSRECMARQIPLIRGGWAAIRLVLDQVEIDPTFVHFVSWCRANGIPVRIVSEGIDRVIHTLLEREQIRVDQVSASHLIEAPDGSLSLTFPGESDGSSCQAGLCKCRFFAEPRGGSTRVFIGDGRSDFCCATKPDLLFARSRLLDYCRRNHIECTAFEDFAAVTEALRALLPSRRVAAAGSKPRPAPPPEA